MQLIEIVQLVLIGFAGLLLLIFFVSYFGYKTKKKGKDDQKHSYSILNETDSLIEAKVNTTNQISTKQSTASSVSLKKFEVFNPNITTSDNKNPKLIKKHFPRTLSIR